MLESILINSDNDAVQRLSAIYIVNRIVDFSEWRARRLCCIAAGDTVAAIVDEANLGEYYRKENKESICNCAFIFKKNIFIEKQRIIAICSL
jgi:hypothetical protein